MFMYDIVLQHRRQQVRRVRPPGDRLSNHCRDSCRTSILIRPSGDRLSNHRHHSCRTFGHLAIASVITAVRLAARRI